MDRNFAKALALVLKSEGGWSDNPKDPGGPTMKGVTLATFRRFVKANATKADLKAISNDQIATVYRRQFWDAVAGAQLPDGVDYAVFDFAVNSGPDRAAKCLQAACGANVKQDGKIGPATLAAVKAKPAGVIIDTLCDARMAFLRRLPTWGTFGKGWASRVASVRSAALAMSDRPTPEKPSIVNVDKPTVPHLVDTKVKEKTNRWSWITTALGGGGIGLGFLGGMDWQAILACGVVLIIVLLILLVLKGQIINAVKDIRASTEG